MTDRSWSLAAALATAAVLGLGLGELTFAPQRLAILGVILLVLLAGGVYVRVLGLLTGLVALLIATCFIDRFIYRVGPVDIRAEQIAALLALALLVYEFLTGRASWKLFRPNASEASLAIWFAIGLVSSLTAAASRTRSVKGLALLLISSLGLVLPRRLIDKARAREQLDVIIKILLIAFAAEGAYGTVAFLAHVFGSQVSMATNVATGHLSAYGTLWEPNVFGAFCAAGAVGWAWLGPRHFRFTWIGIATCLGGTIVSFTRAAWVVGFVILALSVFAPQVRHPANLRQLLFGLVATALIAIAVGGAERIGNYYVPAVPGQPVSHPARHGVLGLLENPIDVIGRVDQVKIAWPDIRAHALIGSGIASFGERHPIAGQPEQHIANLELAVLNDTGALGLIVFLVFMGTIALAAWRQRRDPTVAGLGTAGLVIAITNTATETTELMITWLLLGLLLMAVDVAASGSAGDRSRSPFAP